MWNQMLRRLRFWRADSNEAAALDDEMRLHIELRAEKLRAQGVAPDEAWREASKRFGNRLHVRERSRDMWIVRWADELSKDVRIAMRGLRRSPVFSLTAILTLALGIGANTAIFQLVDAVRLRSLPVTEPNQLALIQLADQKGWRGSQTKPWPTLTNPQWEYLRDHQQIFSGTFAWASHTFGFGEDPRPVRGLFVSGGLFGELGVQPALGRTLTPADDRRGCGLPGAVISHAFWQSQLAGDERIIGRRITVNHHAVEVIGVSAPDFTGLEVGTSFDVAVPICSQAALWSPAHWLDAGAVWWLTVMGRVPAGRSLAEVNAGLRAISPALFETTLSPTYPRESAADYRKMILQGTPGHAGVSGLRETYGDPLILLLAATGLVLLLACANLGNMILARTSSRQAEFALRHTIGASRFRLLRQLMVENLLLAFIGAVSGLALATLMSRFLVTLLSTQGSSLWIDLRPDARLIAFSGVIAALCCLAFGLVPAWRFARANAADSLRNGARATTDRTGMRLREVLVGAQITLSLTLVFGALLFSRSLARVRAVDPGFDARNIFTSWMDDSRLPVPPPARWDFQRELLEAIRATPGVAAAAETGIVPLSGSGGSSSIWLEGKPRDLAIDARTHAIGEGYVAAMGVRLLAGRAFDGRDTRVSQRVALVNETLAKRLGLGSSAVGQRFRKEANPWEPETSFEIVGVVRDSKYRSLKEEAQPIAYYSTAQDGDPGPGIQHVIRFHTPDQATVTALRNNLKTRYPALATDFRGLGATIQNGLLPERLLAVVAGFFGVLAALIAAIGLYGVLSFLVVRRTNEIGIRMALGAAPSHIVRAIVTRAMFVVLLGIVAGAAATVGFFRAAKSMVFGLEPHDPATLAAAVLCLVFISMLASALPALRAVRLDPLAALRSDG